MPYVPRTVPAYSVQDPAYTAEVFALTLVQIDVPCVFVPWSVFTLGRWYVVVCGPWWSMVRGLPWFVVVLGPWSMVVHDS